MSKELKRLENINTNIVKKLGVQALTDRPNAGGAYGKPGMSPAQLKAWFDQYAEFLAKKINAIHDTLASDEIATYIKLALDTHGIKHLQDLIDAMLDGSFAEKLLMVFPTQTVNEKASLQATIFGINKNIADRIKETYNKIGDVEKKITDLGFGYSGAEVIFIEDGDDIGADVDILDEEGYKKIVFTFRNFGKGVAEAALGFPLKESEGTNSLAQKNDSDVENRALTENSVALGDGSIAGAKGYYFTEIFYGDESRYHQIRVSETPPSERGLYISSQALSKNSSFVTPDYALGDKINLACLDHFTEIGTIASVSNDIISFSGNITPFKASLAEQVSLGNAQMAGNYYKVNLPEYDDYTVCVPLKPYVGTVDVAKTAFASGIGNLSAGAGGAAQGENTRVLDAYGNTSGKNTVAGYAASAEGCDTEALAPYSHAQNKGTKATGEGASATGNNTEASGKNSFAGGDGTVASGEDAVALGKDTKAIELAAFSEGEGTEASAPYSHAQNRNTKASGWNASAMGLRTKASGDSALSEGEDTEALGDRSHAAGHGTIASSDDQFVVGCYNKTNPEALFIIGNGTSNDNRSNALEVMRNGLFKILLSDLLRAANGEFFDNGSDVVLSFDFTPCIVFVDDTVYLYDSEIMFDNSFVFKSLPYTHKHHKYCALGYDFPAYNAPATRIIIKYIASSTGEEVTAVDKTVIGEFPEISSIAYADEDRQEYSWKILINGEEVWTVSNYYKKILVLSPDKNSDGSGANDYVHSYDDSLSNSKSMRLTAGRTYTYYINTIYGRA